MVNISKTIAILVLCHIVGDYFIQTDFLAKTKGSNWYHMFCHSALYIIPFAVIFGFEWRVLFMFSVHMIVDSLKARYGKINYVQDQIIHYLTMAVYLI